MHNGLLDHLALYYVIHRTISRKGLYASDNEKNFFNIYIICTYDEAVFFGIIYF